MNNQEFREALKLADLKQSEFAKMTGNSQRQVARWINGEAPLPKTSELVLRLYLMIRGV